MRVPVRIAHPYHLDQAIEVQDALIDTGSTLTTIPRELADRLDLDILGQSRVRTASGEEISDRSVAWIAIRGKDGFGQVSISDSYPGVLVGVVTLETLALAVDPKNERLIDAELLAL